MGSHHGVKARQVRQHVWLRRIELPAGIGQSVAATCLVAREFDAPSGVKPIEWRLLTNREATTLPEAIELIDWYRARWEIEILFNVLKNGCRVEALQLGTIERLERALALLLVVAWRITHLMRLGRSCPDLDAELFFDADEIRGAYLLTDVKQSVQSKLNEVLRLIARLGGFLGCKGDGEPGAKAIWLGLKEVHVAAKTLQKLRAGGHADNCV
ncbi:IS4 family transposase [Burkholderia pseudomallei]|nr:IS4 family transposase [Burkholderia pseudomallei]